MLGSMKVATFNANSIRARLDLVLDWLAEHEPDVLALQEIKCENDKFPIEAFEEAGWHVAVHGQKMHNGVAIVSRPPLQDVSRGLEDPAFPEDCRLIAATVDGIRIVDTYVPNGTRVGSEKFEYKLRWLDRLGAYFRERFRPDDPVIWLGDINIAPRPEDVYDSPKLLGEVGHHPDEFAALDRILAWGWVDAFRLFTQGGGHYTYWDFVIPRAVERNLGWRIDHIYLSPGLRERCVSCVINVEPRKRERPSDHTFVVAELA